MSSDLLVSLFSAFHGSFMMLPVAFAVALRLEWITDASFRSVRLAIDMPDVVLFTVGTVGSIYITLILASLFFLAARKAGPFQKYIIQYSRDSDPLTWELKAGLGVKFVTGTMKSFALYYLLPDMFGVSLPTARHFAFQFAVIWFTWETAFYWWHRMEHMPWLYSRIHKYHHEIEAPTGFHVVQQTVWSDFFLFTFRVIAFKFVVPPLTGHVHVLVFWLWGVVMMYDGVQTHGGLYLPWLPWATRKWFGGALRHEFHHAQNKGVYGWNLTFWDALMGTDKQYQDFEQSFLQTKGKMQ